MTKPAGLLLALVLLLLPHGAEALEVIVGYPYPGHSIGHTAVRVNTYDEHKEVVYDFGRYGKTWGYLKFHGEGIMRVWRGPRAVARYLAKQRSFRSSTGFVLKVSKEEELAIYKYYEKMLETARWSKRHRLHKRYRLAKDYHGVNNQCTSMALEGWKKIVPRERWESVLEPRFNKGQGFNPPTKEYFFQQQRKMGLNEVVVPLDVLDAFRHHVEKGSPEILEVREYPKRGRKRAGAADTVRNWVARLLD